MIGKWFFTAGYLFLTTVTGARAAEPTVVIGLTTGHLVPFMALGRAQHTVSRIYAELGLRVKWSNDATTRIWIEFDEHAPAFCSPGALGYARAHGSEGSRIHILLDRVRQLADNRWDGSVLGHVMAHELGHVLEGVERHSQSGLMKARWNGHELAIMQSSLLSFDAADVDLIHAGLMRLERRVPPDARAASPKAY